MDEPQTNPFFLSLPVILDGMTIVRVIVSWNYLLNGPLPKTDTIKINGVDITGDLIGYGTPDICWGKEHSSSFIYSSDNTGFLLFGGSNSIENAVDKSLGSDPEAYGEGLSILVVYDFRYSYPLHPMRNVDVYAGLTSTQSGVIDWATANFTFTHRYSGGDCHFFLNCLDGQTPLQDEFYINGITASGMVAGTGAAGDAWQGFLGPGIDDNLYDHADDNIAQSSNSFITSPSSSLLAETQRVRDCLGHSFGAVSFYYSDNGGVIIVPDDYDYVQAAIDHADDGDMVIVESGTYVENLDFDGKSITVKSKEGPDVTIIDGNQMGSVITFQSGEGAGSILEGFTITNGVASVKPGGGISCYFSSPTISYNKIFNNSGLYGGGIYCDSSSPMIGSNTISDNLADNGAGLFCLNLSNPTIENNIIMSNHAGINGGGIYCEASSPIIRKNTISVNSATASGSGGGIYCKSSSPTIEYNTIEENQARYGGGGIGCEYGSSPTIMSSHLLSNWAEISGGGVSCFHSSPTIVNNTIMKNSAAGNGGGISCDASSPTVTNTILWNNDAPSGCEIFVHSGNPIVTYCDVKGGWQGTGNIDADPLFADFSNEDIHLTFNSPCRDAGYDHGILPQEDYEGDPRIAQGTVDIGADEFYYHLYLTGDIVAGGSIDIKVVGWPGMSTTLAMGAALLETPFPTQHGDLLLWPLIGSWPLGDIPGSGILVVPLTVPSGWNSGEQRFFQALVGQWGGPYSVLTNLMVAEVE